MIFNCFVVSSDPTVEVGTNVVLTFAAKFEGVVILFWLLPGESPPTPDSVDDAGSLAFSAANAKELFVGDREDDAEDEEPADHDLIVRQCNTGRTSRQN